MPKLRGRLQKFIMPDDCQNPRNDATFCFGFLPPAPVFQTSGFGLLGHGNKFWTAPTIPRLPRPLTFHKSRMPVFHLKHVKSNFNLIKLLLRIIYRNGANRGILKAGNGISQGRFWGFCACLRVFWPQVPILFSFIF